MNERTQCLSNPRTVVSSVKLNKFPAVHCYWAFRWGFHSDGDFKSNMSETCCLDIFLLLTLLGTSSGVERKSCDDISWIILAFCLKVVKQSTSMLGYLKTFFNFWGLRFSVTVCGRNGRLSASRTCTPKVPYHCAMIIQT